MLRNILAWAGISVVAVFLAFAVYSMARSMDYPKRRAKTIRDLFGAIRAQLAQSGIGLTIEEFGTAYHNVQDWKIVGTTSELGLGLYIVLTYQLREDFLYVDFRLKSKAATTSLQDAEADVHEILVPLVTGGMTDPTAEFDYAVDMHYNFSSADFAKRLVTEKDLYLHFRGDVENYTGYLSRLHAQSEAYCQTIKRMVEQELSAASEVVG